LDAFDRWAGRYTGPLAADISTVIEDNPDLLGDIVSTAPLRFAALITNALAASDKHSIRTNAASIAQTMISVSVGLKHQAGDRELYRGRLSTAIELLVR
jgi:hypothetical protein